MRSGNDGGTGPLLRTLRLAAGLTQEELAQRSGLSARAISNLERGISTRPYPNTLAVLADALGLDKTGRARLTGSALPADGAEQPSGAPRQLPAAVSQFTGRHKELQQLTEFLDEASGGGRAVAVSAIGGTAGVGKTALAVHWAHLAAGRFPDGQLYVNLRGYDPAQPMSPGDALAGFLHALGVPGPDIPAEPDDRGARYRSLLAGRRMLVVLDNAGSAEQVRPLLPGTPGCVAIVTSRDSLAGLVARDGAHRLDLDVLPSAEATGLLRALIGDRSADDPAATEALAAQCCYLPLALRVAAEFAAARHDTPLTSVVAELADKHRRLDLLEAGGDARTAVRAVFSWSYQQLDPTAARTFRLVCLHPGPDFDPYAAAALASTPAGRTRQVLGHLERAHLIHPTDPGRYAMHDLLRAYGRDLAATEDGEPGCRAALTRLFDHYLYSASVAMDTLRPAEVGRRPRAPRPGTPIPPVDGSAGARDWLDAERANLIAVTAYTAGHGWPGHTTLLSAILRRHLEGSGHYSESMTVHTCARDAAREAGDRTAEAHALNSLGASNLRRDRYQQAVSYFREAVILFQETGDQAGEAAARSNVAVVEFQLGHYQPATSQLQQALALCRDIGDRVGQARAHNQLGIIDLRQGRYGESARHHRQSLALNRAANDRVGEAFALKNLATVELRQGRHQASDHVQRALALFRETGYRIGEACALATFGEVDLGQGRPERAAGHLQQALTLYREIGDRCSQAQAHSSLAAVLLATDQPSRALEQYTAALALAGQIGDQYEQARAHDGLGKAQRASGDPARARVHWQQALTYYTDLGATPEASQVRMNLLALDEPTRAS